MKTAKERKLKFQDMSLDNFLDNMEMDVDGEDEQTIGKAAGKKQKLAKTNAKVSTKVEPKMRASTQPKAVKLNGVPKGKSTLKENGVKLKKAKIPVPKSSNRKVSLATEEVDSEDDSEYDSEEEPTGKLNGIGKRKAKLKENGTASKKVKAPVSKPTKRPTSRVADDEDSEEDSDEMSLEDSDEMSQEDSDGVSQEEDDDENSEEDDSEEDNSEEDDSEEDKSEEDDSEDGSDVDTAASIKDVEKEHRKALDRLQTTDPELYAFLKKNDRKLLKFGKMAGSDEELSDDSEGEESEDIESDDDENKEDEDGNVHKLPDKLEVASDESDFNSDDQDEDDAEASVEPGTQKKITLKMLEKWTNALTARPVKRVETIREVCRAFKSALHTVTGEQEVLPPYKVEGAAIFNGVLQLCVLYLSPAVNSFLKVKDNHQFKDLKKNNRFSKVRGCLRLYLIDLTNLLENVTSKNVTSVLLKHLHQFSSILLCFPQITKPILKRLIIVWSTSDEETIRVLAFLCVLKITRGQQQRFLADVLKAMYLAYVKNSKFVSPNTLPYINFMRRSLMEMFLLDFTVSYQHMFLYIRQLAIHLRNATILQKKDSYRFIYNWQYVNSLKLWGDILAAAHPFDALEPLIYPFVSITIGVIKLIPSAQYFPVRFHCCQILNHLHSKTGIFIPVLPFLLEVLKSNSFNVPHKQLSMRPVNLSCLLRIPPANIQQNGYKDAIVEQLYELSLQFAADESASVAFPELVVPIVLQLRQYAKSSKVYQYSRKMKLLSDKLMENYEFIEKQRQKMNIPLKDVDAIKAWEEQIRVGGTPLRKFYDTFAKETERVKRRQATDSENISDYKLPTLKKLDKEVLARKKSDGPLTLFPSDDEDDEEIDFGLEMEKEDKKKKKKKEKKQKVPRKATEETAVEEDVPTEYVAENDQLDIVKDLQLDDWDD